jgi:hypothetical protein
MHTQSLDRLEVIQTFLVRHRISGTLDWYRPRPGYHLAVDSVVCELEASPNNAGCPA